MKKLLLLALALSLPLAQAVRADNNNNKRKHREEATAPRAPAKKSQPVQRSVQRPPQTQRRVAPTGRTFNAQTDSARSGQLANRNNNRHVVNRGGDRNPGTVNRGHVNRGNTHVQRNRPHRNVDPNSFANARHRGVNGRHDRGWWRRHYGHTTFVLFGGGYYYWDAGYWFPAYGYSPIYNNYSYSEPIYGYNDLAPGQVLENVQLALRDLGYYRGAIDGLIGPQTRDALAAFQRDNGLVETAAIDEPTLVTLGLA